MLVALRIVFAHVQTRSSILLSTAASCAAPASSLARASSVSRQEGAIGRMTSRARRSSLSSRGPTVPSITHASTIISKITSANDNNNNNNKKKPTDHETKSVYVPVAASQSIRRRTGTRGYT